MRNFFPSLVISQKPPIGALHFLISQMSETDDEQFHHTHRGATGSLSAWIHVRIAVLNIFPPVINCCNHNYSWDFVTIHFIIKLSSPPHSRNYLSACDSLLIHSLDTSRAILYDKCAF